MNSPVLDLIVLLFYLFLGCVAGWCALAIFLLGWCILDLIFGTSKAAKKKAAAIGVGEIRRKRGDILYADLERPMKDGPGDAIRRATDES